MFKGGRDASSNMPDGPVASISGNLHGSGAVRLPSANMARVPPHPIGDSPSVRGHNSAPAPRIQ
jgi:hypothetical protein